MRKQFKQDTGEIRAHRFAVVRIAEVPPAPGRIVQAPDVIHDLCLHQVGKVPVGEP